MKEFEVIYQGVCLFCGNKAAENYYSGSWETYLKCDCDGVKNYFKLSDALQAAKRPAERLLKKLQLEDKKKQLERELEYTNRELEQLG